MPSPNQFHSEFGYMCPTPRFRRVVRVTFVAGVAGAIAGAVGVIALAQRADVERMRTEIASTVSSTVSSTVGMAVTNASPAIAPPAPRTALCSAQSWPFIDKTCLLGTERTIRTLPETFAAIPPRAVSPRAVPPQAAAPSAFAPAAVALGEDAQPPNAHAEAASAKASQSTAAPAKKRPKTVQRRERAPERQDANPRSAYVDPMTYEQWRHDGGRYDTGRYYENGYGREQSRDRRGFFW
jgi:hypothetical protein